MTARATSPRSPIPTARKLPIPTTSPARSRACRTSPSQGSWSDIASSISYAPTGQPSSITFGNGVTTANTFDASALYRLVSKVTTLPSGARAQDFAYTYDPVGNITQLTNNATTTNSASVSYQYDALNRLVAATTISAVSSPYAQLVLLRSPRQHPLDHHQRDDQRIHAHYYRHLDRPHPWSFDLRQLRVQRGCDQFQHALVSRLRGLRRRPHLGHVQRPIAHPPHLDGTRSAPTPSATWSIPRPAATPSRSAILIRASPFTACPCSTTSTNRHRSTPTANRRPPPPAAARGRSQRRATTFSSHRRSRAPASRAVLPATGNSTRVPVMRATRRATATHSPTTTRPPTSAAGSTMQ